MEKRYQVFVSSTYADLKHERQHVIQTLMEMDCIPSGMELFPAQDEEQWNFIQRVIDDCDYYLLIIGGKYGSLTDEGISYTEKEFEYAVSQGLRIIALIHKNPEEISLKNSETDPELKEKLDKFKETVCENRLVKFWNHANELPGLVSLSLIKTIKTYPATGWVRADRLSSEDSLTELYQLRKENQKLREELDKYKSYEEIDTYSELADIESTITFNGKIRVEQWGNRGSYYRSWEVTTTWKQLFSYISPFLVEHPHDAAVKSRISRDLAGLAEAGTGTAMIDDQQFKTITIQLEAYGLISTNYTKTTKGGMALFWSLTPKGNKYMFHLRAIHKSEH